MAKNSGKNPNKEKSDKPLVARILVLALVAVMVLGIVIGSVASMGAF